MKKIIHTREHYFHTGVKMLAIFFVLFAFASCGSKEVKTASYEAKISQEAFSLAETLRAAYVKRDFTAIAEISTQEGYRDILDNIRHFDTVDLTFTPKWVELEKQKTYLNIAWKGTWVVSGETVRERGMAVFLFEGTPLKLSKIVRGSPFIYPDR